MINRKITTRVEAKATTEKRYFTGKPCLRGHIAERLTSSGNCFHCVNEKHTATYRANPAAGRARSAAWAAKNREKISIRAAEMYQLNPEKFRARRRAAYRMNPEIEREKVAKWRKRNPGYWHKHREKLANYQRENPGKKRTWQEKYKSQNLNKYAAYAAKRRFIKLSQRCECCRDSDLEKFYFEALEGTEVDHVKALALGGMHCAENLQILTIAEHKKKTRLDMALIAAMRRTRRRVPIVAIH